MEKLIEAINRDNLVDIKKICKSGVDLNSNVKIGMEYDLDSYDEIPILFYAIRSGASLEAIELLVKNGADIFITDSDGVGAIDIAIKFKRDDVVKFCIDKGIDINSTKRKSGITPLLLASCFNNIDIIELLIENGADINATDKSGMGAKDYARKLGQKRVVEFLEKQGAKFNIYQNENIKKEKESLKNRKKPTQDMGFDKI
jgi:ankyrin repeat protein